MENFSLRMEEGSDRRKQMRLESNGERRQDQTKGATYGNTYRHGSDGGMEVDCVVISDDSNSVGVDISTGSLASIIGSQSLSKFGITNDADSTHNGTRERKTKGRYKEINNKQGEMYHIKGQYKEMNSRQETHEVKGYNERKSKKETHQTREQFRETDIEQDTTFNKQGEMYQIRGQHKETKNKREIGHKKTRNEGETHQTREQFRETNTEQDTTFNKQGDMYQIRGRKETKNKGDRDDFRETDIKLRDTAFNRTSECDDRRNNYDEDSSVDVNEKQDSNGMTEDLSDTTSLPPPPLHRNFENPLMAINYVGEFKVPQDNYTKGCKWSPDGSCLLVTSKDSKIRLFNLPPPVQQGKFTCESWFAEEALKYSVAAVTVREKETIYDYSWYPQMRSDIPSSCCFASTCRDQPVHLWDAWNGDLICSYLPYNHLDEMVAGYSVEFSLDGSRIVVGFSKCIRTFHTHRPGRYFEEIEAKNQPGIISCMSFNPQLTSVFAAGSYLGSVGLYNLERNTLFCRMEGDIGGVTQVKFSSCGTKLFSGSRKNNEILCWDIRKPGTLLCGYQRQVSTSQRIYFDLEPHYNRFLVSGDTNGNVLKWDLAECESDSDGGDVTKEPSSVFVAHKDCTNGVSLHPFCPVLATSSGQRHFPEPVSSSPPHLDSCSEDEEPKSLFTASTKPQENTVKLWWMGDA